MAENENGGTATAEQTQKTRKPRKKPEGKSPSALEFARAFNDESVRTRKDVVDLLVKQGFHMTYGALVAREKNYREANVHLKELEAAPRGRRINAEAINAEIDQQVGSEAVKGEGEQSEGQQQQS
jgi:hypothetical protein